MTTKKETSKTMETVETMETLTVEKEVIDLQEISLKLLSNDSVKENAKFTPCIITVNNLKKKIPVLKSLPDNFPLVQIRLKGLNYQVLLPCLYRDKENYIVAIPDLNASISSDLKVISHKKGKNGYCILQYKDTNIYFKTSMSISQTHKVLEQSEKENEDFFDFTEELGLPHINLLKSKPKVLIALKNLPLKKTLEIIGSGGVSEYKNLLLSIKNLDTEDFYHNVISNSVLEKMWKEKGIGFKFLIDSIDEIPQKYKEGTKEKVKIVTKVTITPLEGVNFSDFKL
jgi:hypothetical protein